MALPKNARTKRMGRMSRRHPIPEMIDLFLNGKSYEAGKALFDNNLLSVICSLVCDHEKQCEGHCIQGKKGMAIHWSSIENHISDNYLLG